MAVPKQCHTKSRRDKRRANQFIKGVGLFFCPKCRQAALPHRVCLNCGFYKGREVINVLAKLEKKERKKKEKEVAETEKEKPNKEKSMDLQELSKKKF